MELLKQFKGKGYDSPKNPPTYIIGVDTYDKNSNAYCLGRKMINGNLDVVMIKAIENEDEFWDEVNNLSKYFNAKVFRES